MLKKQLSNEMKWNGVPLSQMSYPELKVALSKVEHDIDHTDYSKPMYELMINSQLEFTKQQIKAQAVYNKKQYFNQINRANDVNTTIMTNKLFDNVMKCFSKNKVYATTNKAVVG